MCPAARTSVHANTTRATPHSRMRAKEGMLQEANGRASAGPALAPPLLCHTLLCVCTHLFLAPSLRTAKGTSLRRRARLRVLSRPSASFTACLQPELLSGTTGSASGAFRVAYPSLRSRRVLDDQGGREGGREGEREGGMTLWKGRSTSLTRKAIMLLTERCTSSRCEGACRDVQHFPLSVGQLVVHNVGNTRAHHSRGHPALPWRCPPSPGCVFSTPGHMGKDRGEEARDSACQHASQTIFLCQPLSFCRDLACE